MNKKRFLIGLSLIVLLLLSISVGLVSAFSISDFWGKITGKVVYNYGDNLLKNPGFDAGTQNWKTLYSNTTIGVMAENGNNYARTTVGESSNKTCWPSLATGSPEHCNAVVQDVGKMGADKMFIAKARFRAPAGTKAKLILKATPYEGVITRETTKDGNGQWQTIETSILTTTVANDVLTIRLVSQSPDASGTWTEWDDVKIVEGTEKEETICTDTDGGVDYYVKGLL